MMVCKRKLQNKTVSKKYNALKDLEKGLSNKEFPQNMVCRRIHFQLG